MAKAAVLITASKGTVDTVARKVKALGVTRVVSVTGRVDVVVFLEGSRGDIVGKLKELLEIEEVETTETLWEVEI